MSIDFYGRNSLASETAPVRERFPRLPASFRCFECPDPTTGTVASEGGTYCNLCGSQMDEMPSVLNLANGNAAAFLRFLGFEPFTSEGLSGEITLADARRGVMKARATFTKRVGAFTREKTSSGHLTIDGVAHLDIPRMVSGGIGEDYFATRLDQFAKLVEDFAGLGATHIYWG